MAQPKTHRTGFSRKAQLGVFAGYLVAGGGALLGLILLAISIFQPGAFDGLRGSATDIAAPAGEAGAVARSGGRTFFQNIAAYYRAGSRNADLEEEVRLARVRLAEARALERENERLKRLLNLSRESEDRVATARLIGSTAASTRRIAFLSAGRGDGVQPGMPVRSPLGLIGRVLESGRSSARVLLLTDPESIVPVRRAQDDVIAFAEGRADGTLALRLINLGINPLEPGDVMVTTGAGGLYRPGVAVAVVDELTRDGAIGRVLANPAATDFVLVETAYEGQARRAIRETVAEREASAVAPVGE